MLKECGHTCPLGQFAEVTYDGGTANAGPAIRINATAGRFSFYGLVALYIPAQTGIALVLYNGQNLAGIGTVVTTLVLPLLLGDVLRIEASSTSVTSYAVKVNGTTVIDATLSESQVSPLNSCVGFVEVFDVPDGIIGPEDEAVVKVKSADQSKISDTTLAFDSELKVPVGASETWVIHASITFKAISTVPDIKFGMFGPPGSTGKWIENFEFFDAFDLNVTVIDAAFTVELHFTIDAVCVNGATPGDFGFQWAQNTSSGDATIVMANSFLVANKKV